MVGLMRLDNLEALAEKLASEGVPGDFVECGVWRGGASIFMRGLLKAHDVQDRSVRLVDSFDGAPDGCMPFLSHLATHSLASSPAKTGSTDGPTGRA
jgi:hypothetical protein